jgi:hypothetical protein
MAIDGVVESPEKWSLSYWNDDIANVVMGRHARRGRTTARPGQYEGFAEAWPDHTVRGRSRCGLHANVKKYVVSRTWTNLFRV